MTLLPAIKGQNLTVTGNLQVNGSTTTNGQAVLKDTLFVQSFTRVGALACQGAFVAAQTATFNSAINVPTAVQSPAFWDANGNLKSGAVGILITSSPQTWPNNGLNPYTGCSPVVLNNCSQQANNSSFQVNRAGIYSVQATVVFQSSVQNNFLAACISVGPSSLVGSNNTPICWGGDTQGASGGITTATLSGCVVANANDYISVVLNTNTQGGVVAVPASFAIFQIA